MRRAHLLRGAKGNETPSECVWFDTETYQTVLDGSTVEHHLEFGWAAYTRMLPSGKWMSPDWFRFTSIAEFWDWAVSKARPKTKLFMFCHNTSFDLPVMDIFTELPNRGYVLKQAVIDAPPTILKWRSERHTIQVLDTLNIWAVPLARIGEMIGLPKLQMPVKGASIAEWDSYGKRDTEIIMIACQRWFAFLRENDMGGFANTLAGQAFRTYKHRFLRHDILIDDSEEPLRLSRSCYLGGRVEAFFIGRATGSYRLVDINSMYPAVMSSELYPTVLRGYTSRATIEDLGIWLSDSCCCAQVTVRTDRRIYPVRRDGQLLFPVGEFRAYLSTPELIEAYNAGEIVAVHEVAVYDCAPIFKDFVDEMYSRRLECAESGDSQTAHMYKILMNSLYGKFGQNGLMYSEFENTPDLSARKWTEIDAETGTIINWRQFGGLVQRQERNAESRDSHPAIAAHVTAYARMLLHDDITLAGEGNCLYVDTDSLLVTDEGYKNLAPQLDDKSLGMLKLELTCTDIVIHGPKDYRFGDKVRTKGVRSKAVWVGGDELYQDKWTSLKGLLATGHITAPQTSTRGKTLRRIYKKGIVGATGAVSPISLDE